MKSTFSSPFSGLTSGVQLFSLFKRRPDILKKVIYVTSLSKQLADALAKQVSVLDVARKLKSIFKSNINIEITGKFRIGDIRHNFADISKIKSELGWAPQVPIEDGVAEILKHIEYWRDAPVWSPDSIAEATRDWFRYLS